MRGTQENTSSMFPLQQEVSHSNQARDSQSGVLGFKPKSVTTFTR